jgi:type VI protein secretion system component Hcp
MVSGARTASAQITTFMFVPGIPGGSADITHAEWIDVDDLTQAWPGPAQPTRRTTCEVTVRKQLDIAGPRLWAAAVTGQVFAEIKIDVLKPGPARFRIYEAKLHNAQITRMATFSSYIQGQLFEDVTVSPETVTLTAFTQDPDGSPGEPVVATFPCRATVR